MSAFPADTSSFIMTEEGYSKKYYSFYNTVLFQSNFIQYYKLHPDPLSIHEDNPVPQISTFFLSNKMVGFYKARDQEKT